MSYAIEPPVEPMLAKAVHELPLGEDLSYEPKWDGFRCLVFRSGEEVLLSSRNERPLNRYFPELVELLRVGLPDSYVLDGEIVIAGPNGLDFDALLQRIHPAASRVELLSRSDPASFVAFDLLALGDDLRGEPFRERRAKLERLFRPGVQARLTPSTSDPNVALDWLERFEGAGLDGVVAKRGDLSYRPGERVMFKLKHERSADCVVAGYRLHADKASVGSLLLGLYDSDGVLQHVGVTSTFTAARRRELLGELEPYQVSKDEPHPWLDEDHGGRRPGTPSRWSANKDLSFVPLRPELVCEVAYDHLQGDRFRHGTTFRRWRTDRDPASCTYDQLEAVVPTELAEVFSS